MAQASFKAALGDDATIERLRRSSAGRSLEVVTPTRNWHFNEPLGSSQWRSLDSRLAALPEELERRYADEVEVYYLLERLRTTGRIDADGHGADATYRRVQA